MTESIDPEMRAEISAKLGDLNMKLEESVNAATNQAFNLGCALGLLPATLLVIATYFLTGNSWLGAVVMFVLMVLGLVLFANMVASITRRNTLKRKYHDEIEPQIIKLAAEKHLEKNRIYNIGSTTLPIGSALLELFPGQPASNAVLQSEEID